MAWSGKDGEQDIGERSFHFALRIVKVCKVLDESPGIARTLGRQLIRSGTSVGANIKEGKAGQSRPDFISKHAIALKEAHETAYWLDLVLGSELLKPELLVPLRKECDELIAILTAILKQARKNQA